MASGRNPCSFEPLNPSGGVAHTASRAALCHRPHSRRGSVCGSRPLKCSVRIPVGLQTKPVYWLQTRAQSYAASSTDGRPDGLQAAQAAVPRAEDRRGGYSFWGESLGHVLSFHVSYFGTHLRLSLEIRGFPIIQYLFSEINKWS